MVRRVASSPARLSLAESLMELDRTTERLGMAAVSTDAEGSQKPSAKAKRSQMPLGNAELEMVARALAFRRDGRASIKRKVEKLRGQRDAVADMEADRAKKPLDRFVIPCTPIQMNHVLVLDGRNCISLRAFLGEVVHRLGLREGACQTLDDFRAVLDGKLGGLKPPFTVAVTHAADVPQPLPARALAMLQEYGQRRSFCPQGPLTAAELKYEREMGWPSRCYDGGMVDVTLNLLGSGEITYGVLEPRSTIHLGGSARSNGMLYLRRRRANQ